MRLKDHYKTLGVSPTATQQDIKKAWRRLAFEYHPDQNPANAFAEANFKELQEAYTVLSHPAKRRAYDEERWLMGMGNAARQQQEVTPQWILHECLRLSRHMATIDTYRMSHRSLRDYIALLLSDAHIGVLQRFNESETNAAIIKEVLTASRHLQYDYMTDVALRLQAIAGEDTSMNAFIATTLQKHKKMAGIDKFFTVIILAAAVLLALFMYFYGRKK